MLIKRFNIKTPGRDSEVKLFTKADYKSQKEVPITTSGVVTPVKSNDLYHDLAIKVIAAYGGKENIKNVDACITKLRVQVNDQSKVQRDVIKSLGAAGIFNVGAQSVYSVFGNKADIIKNKMNDILFPN
jgi:glucose-like phosphotransferase system IIB component